MAHKPNWKSESDAVNFISERLLQSARRFKSCDPDFRKRDEDWKRALVELMRGEITLPPGDVRQLLADEMERLFFPSKARDRAEGRQAYVWASWPDQVVRRSPLRPEHT